MNIFKSMLTRQTDIREVDTIESWMVTWCSRYGSFTYPDPKNEAIVFTEKESAIEFAESLKEANKLLRNTVGINLKVSRCGSND